MALNGTLKFLVLKFLSKKQNNGCSLINQIKEKTGWKVSPGSLYPLMRELVSLKFIKLKKQANSKTYQITTKGRNFLKNADSKKKQIKKRIEESINFLELIGEKKEAENLKKIQERTFQFTPSQKAIEKMNKIINKIDVKKNQQKINKIFEEALNKLEKLK